MRGPDGLTRPPAQIVDFMHENPLVDGNEWLGLLMQHEDYDMRAIGLRILETRELYTNDVFDFEEMNLKVRTCARCAGRSGGLTKTEGHGQHAEGEQGPQGPDPAQHDGRIPVLGVGIGGRRRWRLSFGLHAFFHIHFTRFFINVASPGRYH